MTATEHNNLSCEHNDLFTEYNDKRPNIENNQTDKKNPTQH